MPQQTTAGEALYVAWKIEPTDENAARRVKSQLRSGQERNLYTLRSWVIAGGEAHALISPAAPLEQIAEAIWERPADSIAARWIRNPKLCAKLTREIETAPVALGLAKRPEQWPFSSAFTE